MKLGQDLKTSPVYFAIPCAASNENMVVAAFKKENFKQTRKKFKLQKSK